MPLTARPEQMFAAGLPALPHATRRVLLLAAAAGTAHLSDVLHTVPGAERPEDTVYQAASFAERREAHLTLSAALTRPCTTTPPFYHLADLAASVRAGQADDARTVLHAAERSLEKFRSTRLAAVVHRAAALLGDPDDAEPRFRAAIDPVGARRPFEHAVAHLDFGEWLSRRRRSAAECPLLGTAPDIF